MFCAHNFSFPSLLVTLICTTFRIAAPKDDPADEVDSKKKKKKEKEEKKVKKVVSSTSAISMTIGRATVKSSSDTTILGKVPALGGTPTKAQPVPTPQIVSPAPISQGVNMADVLKSQSQQQQQQQQLQQQQQQQVSELHYKSFYLQLIM